MHVARCSQQRKMEGVAEVEGLPILGEPEECLQWQPMSCGPPLIASRQGRPGVVWQGAGMAGCG